MNKKLLMAVGATCLVAGFFCGGVLARLGMAKDMRELSGKLDVLMETVQCRPEDSNEAPKATEVPELGENTSEPIETIEPEEITETKPDVMIPEDILVEDGVSYYWGEVKNGLPHGQGTLLEGGYYYTGHFNEGMKDGEFEITPLDDPARKLVIIYKDNQIVTEELTFEKAFVSHAELRFRNHAGLNSEELTMLHEGDVVYITNADPVEIDNIEWVEIIYDGIVGWASSRGLERTQP